MAEQKKDYSEMNRIRIDRRDLIDILSKFEGRDIDIMTAQFPNGRVALEISNPKKPHDPSLVLYDRTVSVLAGNCYE